MPLFANAYALGAIALGELLVTERELYEAQAVLTRAHTAAAVQLVALYKALGGGWSPEATATTVSQ